MQHRYAQGMSTPVPAPVRGPGSNRDDHKIYVGNLPLSTSHSDLASYFESLSIGRVSKALVKTEIDSGRPLGYGFVTFSDQVGRGPTCALPVYFLEEDAVVNLEARYFLFTAIPLHVFTASTGMSCTQSCP